MGNLGTQADGSKESYMKPLYPLIESHVSRVKTFLDQLVDVPDELGKHSILFLRLVLFRMDTDSPHDVVVYLHNDHVQN